MRQILHRSARETRTVRALIQRSNAALSRKSGINVKTVTQWRKQRIAAAAIVMFTALGHFQGCSWSLAPQYALAQTLDPAARKVKAAFDTWADTSDIRDASLVLLKDDRIIVKLNRSSYTTTKVEPVASNSKLITGLCIARLVDSSQLRFASKLSELLPAFFLRYTPADARAKKITIANLLTHQSGITSDPSQGASLNEFAPFTEPSAEQQLAAALSVRLGKKPGGNYRYNNMNYAALGLVIKNVTGQRYETYCNNAVLRPLGITNASIDPRLRVAGAYGGWRISAEDYAKLMKYFARNSRLLKSTPRDWPGAFVDKGVHYSLGTLIRKSGSWYNFWHFGSWERTSESKGSFGAYFADWGGHTMVIANYAPTVTPAQMSALDAAMATATLK